MQLYNASSSYYSMIARLALFEAGVQFDDHRLDIHFKKEQLAPWYQNLNPKMTVPTLIDGNNIYTDSRDILNFAQSHANNNWLDSDRSLEKTIKALQDEFYAIQIEKITFAKAMLSIPPLHYVFPRLLKKIIKQLELERASAPDKNAVAEKIKLNEARIAFFTQGSLRDKFEHELLSVTAFLTELPKPAPMILGERLSSIDILTATLLTRLTMIGEYGLLKDYAAIDAWFQNFKERPNFGKADMWLRFQPMRILLRT